MIITELTPDYIDAIKPLFSADKYMGVDQSAFNIENLAGTYNDVYHSMFVQAYMSGLSSYRAFGCIEDGIVTATIATYESADNAEWYWTQVRSNNSKAIPLILDAVADYNELHGRLKFYSLFNSKYAKVYRRLAFSPKMKERYGFFDEFLVPAKHKCIYTTPWQSLFGRTLLPTETIMRCTFLKQEYRDILPIAGAL
jgi:hypothetical protein